jgi:hypothetical protein
MDATGRNAIVIDDRNGDSMTDPIPELRVQLCALTEDNGEEWLWAEPVEGGAYRVLSVPVFAYNVSRGTVVTAEMAAVAQGLRITGVRSTSDGATARVYLAEGMMAREFYTGAFVPAAERCGLQIGPATLLEPTVVALHIRERESWRPVAQLLDQVVAAGHASFWELGDPDASPPADDASEVSERPRWRLVHPPPGDPIASARRE